MEKLDGWVVALAAGKTFFGKVDRAGRLEPCYQFTIVQVQVPQQTPQGVSIRLQAQRLIGTIENFNSWTALTLPEGAIVRECNSFSTEEQEMLAKNLTDIEGFLVEQERVAKVAAMNLEATKLKPYAGPREDDRGAS